MLYYNTVNNLLSALEKNNDTHQLLQNIYFTLVEAHLANDDCESAYETRHKLWLTGIYANHPA